MFIGFELASALLALLIAQFIKLVLGIFLDGKLNISLLFSTGGIPSSHTALTAALATAFAISYGFNSPFFAISLVLTLIVAHDAAGVRWQAGMHASEINSIKNDIQRLYQAMASQEPYEKNKQQLKELLGHKPLEVILGALLGVAVSVIYMQVFL